MRAALADLDEAIKLEESGSPVRADDHTNRARLLMKDHRDAEALSACNAAIADYEDYSEAHRLRIGLLINIKRFAEVIPSCDALIAHGTAPAKVYEQRGLAHAELKNYAEAIEDYTLAMTHASAGPAHSATLSELHLVRGRLYIVAGSPRLALGDFGESIRLDPLNPEGYEGRGSARARLGDHHAAVADAQKALELGKSNQTWLRLYRCGRIYAQAANAAGAEARRNPWNTVALVRQYQDRAAFLLGEALKRSPADQCPALWQDIRTDPELRAIQRRVASVLQRDGSALSSASPQIQPKQWVGSADRDPAAAHGTARALPTMIMNPQGSQKQVASRSRRDPFRDRPSLTIVGSNRGSSRLRPRVEPLESRGLLSAFLVDTTADSGPGSLRQAILDADAASTGSNCIDFDIPGEGVQTISLASPLPSITESTLIDGWSQPGHAGSALIRLVGGQSAGAPGLTISGPSVTIRGLAVEAFGIDATADEQLVAQVQPQGSNTALSLLDSQGTVLVESDGSSSADPDAEIDEHLAPATYMLQVADLGETGDYSLTTTLTPVTTPFQALSISPSSPYGPVAVGDFTGDGILDLAAPDGIHLGIGDGTFASPVASLGLPALPEDESITDMIAADFNGDGRLDLAMTYNSNLTYGGQDQGGVIVLMGNGNGTFQPAVFYAAGDNPASLVAGDFTGDGKLDLAVTDKGEVADGKNVDGGVSVLMGTGNGSFEPFEELVESSDAPQALVAGNFTADGRLDLAVANRASNNVSILGVGDDGMPEQAAPPIPVGSSPHSTPYSLVAGDFNGDGRLDLAVANYATADVTIIMGNGNGTFQTTGNYPVGQGPQSIIAGDFLGNGKLDLVLVDTSSDEVSLLPGNGDGTFQAVEQTVLAFSPEAVAAGDFNGDGRLDLAVTSSDVASGVGTISILLGKGDGTFQTSQSLAGNQPVSEATGDFNGDGYLDVATANASADAVSILLGEGDGTFQPAQQIALGFSPAAVVAGDFNGDGRLDLAVAGSISSGGLGEVAILLGNGDGTFQPPEYYTVGEDPTALIAADFSNDGSLDLAVANTESDSVSILIGIGDGSFQPPKQYSVGEAPVGLVAGDFNGDRQLDLAVANLLGNSVTILLNHGDGTLGTATTVAVGGRPKSLAVGNFSGNGPLDLAVADSGSDSISILQGDGDGKFQTAEPIALDFSPGAIVAADFSGDGPLDMAVSGPASGDGPGEVVVLPGNGNGTFQYGGQYMIGTGSESLVAGDFNGDGRLDLAVAGAGSNGVSVLLGNGDGTFVGAGSFATTPIATPVVADVNGDGTDDVLVVDGAGEILYRQGIPGQPGSFEPPITVNPPLPDGANPYASRDIAWVPNTIAGPLLASVDAQDNALSLYAYRDGSFVRVGSLMTGQLPAQIIAADLNGTGWDDLVVRNAGDGTLSIFFANHLIGPVSPFSPQIGLQAFLPPVTLSVGLGDSDVQTVDTTGGSTLNLVVTNKLSGQVSVLVNLGDGAFAPPILYRAGAGLSAIEASSTSPEVTSLEATAGVAAGPLTLGGPTDLVTVNPGSNTLDVLVGLGGGRFTNPVEIQTQSPVQVMREGDFTGSGIIDLAVLTSVGLSIYLGNGKGGFLLTETDALPSEADGLAVADLTGNGKLDILVGDAYGDVLVLLGKGNGTFLPYHEANQTIELAVADLTGNGSEDIIFADQGLDRVVVDYGASKSTVLADRSTGLLQPGAVALADLNGDRIPDLIVANSGSNNVLIYPGLGNGQFGPAINGGNGYFVGTNPEGITVANLTPTLPDLVVADEGSNQVSILFNQSRKGGAISFSPGPRLNSGGLGPVSTVVIQFKGQAFPDILVTNSESNDVVLLPGVGQGFFNDQNRRVYSVGTDPSLIFSGNFNGAEGIVTVDTDSNELTLLSGITGPSPVTTNIPSDGVDPDSAFEFQAPDGFDDLVVGNSGDDVLALFAGGKDGLTLMSTEPGLPDLTALAFLAVTGGQVQFYAAAAGQEAVELLSLSLGDAFTGIPGTVVQLVSLSDYSFPLVATLLTLTVEVSNDEANRGDSEFAATSPADSLPETTSSVGQTLMSLVRENEASGDESDAFVGSEHNGDIMAPAGSSSWERLFLGLDEVIERFGRDQSVRPEAENPTPAGNRPRSRMAPASSTSDGPTSFDWSPEPFWRNRTSVRLNGPRGNLPFDPIDTTLSSSHTDTGDLVRPVRLICSPEMPANWGNRHIMISPGGFPPSQASAPRDESVRQILEKPSCIRLATGWSSMLMTAMITGRHCHVGPSVYHDKRPSIHPPRLRIRRKGTQFFE